MDVDLRRFRRVWKSPLILAAILGLGASAGYGQGPNDPLKVQRGAQLPNQPPAVIQQQQQPFYIQAAVVVLLSGGAVWTVCRSSRRQ